MGRRPLCLVALLFVLWVLLTQKSFLGEALHMTGTGQADMALPGAVPGQFVRVRGQVYRQEKKNTNQIYLKHNSVLSGTSHKSYDFNILVFIDEDTDYQIGNILEVTGMWQGPEEASNPGQFDMAAWYHSQKIGVMMNKCRIRLLDGRKDTLRQAVSEFRRRLSESFYGIAEEEDASLMCAMLLGDKNGIDEKVKQLYQEGGISHVLAISGLHISMLGLLLFGVVRKLGMSFAGAGVFSGVLMGFYCVMTGMGVSTLRAFLMFLVYLGAQIFGRTYDLKSSLALAVILILFQNPQYLFQGGFQLSVLAVAGLAYVYPALKKKLPVKNRLTDSFLVSISVQLAIFPCLLYHYYQFSAMALFLNLLILPAMSVLLLAGLASGVAGLVFLPAGVLAFAPCHYILRYMEALCSLSLRVPGALRIWGRPETASIFLYYGILLAVLLALEKGGEGRRGVLLWGGLLAFGTAGLSFHRTEGMEMTFLDVGQGDSIFWQTEDGVRFLCDGGSSGEDKVGKYRLIPFLKCRGVRRLDYLFLTHMDTDHVNGIGELLEGDTGITVGCLVMPDVREKDETYRKFLETAARKEIPVLEFHEGMKMKKGQWTLECLAPEEGADYGNQNEGSLVLSVQYGSFRALLTGDVEGNGEKRLMESGNIRKVSVLKVAHHGSKNSTPEEFLEMAEPAVSVISCGRDNSYGHPSPELLERLEDAGTAVYKTMEQGAVTVRTDGEMFSVEGYHDF